MSLIWSNIRKNFFKLSILWLLYLFFSNKRVVWQKIGFLPPLLYSSQRRRKSSLRLNFYLFFLQPISTSNFLSFSPYNLRLVWTSCEPTKSSAVVLFPLHFHLQRLCLFLCLLKLSQTVLDHRPNLSFNLILTFILRLLQHIIFFFSYLKQKVLLFIHDYLTIVHFRPVILLDSKFKRSNS